MLSGGKDTILAMAAACMKQMTTTTAVLNGCCVGDEAARVFVVSAEAKAPCNNNNINNSSSNKDEAAANAAAVCSRSKSREALLNLLGNKSGEVPPAARRMALNLLLKIVRPASGRELDSDLLSKVLCALIENRGSVSTSLDCLASKYFVLGGDAGCCALERIPELLKRVTKGETRGLEEELLKLLYDRLLGEDPLTPRVAAPGSEQKAERDKQFLEQITDICSRPLQKVVNEPGDDDSSRYKEAVWDDFKLVSSRNAWTCNVAEEQETAERCKASGLLDIALKQPEKTVSGLDTSALMVTAARGRGNETNSGSAVKASGYPRKKASKDDDVEEEEEEGGGGDESNGDEGDSDDPDHTGNEGDEDGEEAEEEEEVDEDGDEDEDDDREPQPQAIGSNATRNASNSNNNNNNNNVIGSGGGGGGGLGLDEEEEEEEDESDQDGGVEDDGDGDDGEEDGAEEEEGDDGEDEDDGAPPKKKAKK